MGLLLVGAAWWLRSSRWMREAVLRGQEIPELEAAVRERPDDALAQYYLAKRYYTNRRFSDARDAYEKAIHLEPDSARAHLGLALSLFELGDLERARGVFEEALKRDNRLAWAEYMIGKIAWLQGRTAAALPHVKRATELDPRSDQAWYGLAVCYIQLNRFEEGAAALRQAIRRNEASARYHTALGEVLVYRGETDEGRKHYERAYQLNPNYGPICALMGNFYLKKESGPDALDRAEELLLKATELYTYHPESIYFDLGQLYVRKGRYKKAVDALLTSIRLDPRDERAYYALANAYRRLGDRKAAAAAEKRFQQISNLHVQQQTLEARVFHDPNSVTARLNLARLYRDLGLLKEAREQYEAGLRLQPDSEALKREYEQFLKDAGARLRQQYTDFILQLPEQK